MFVHQYLALVVSLVSLCGATLDFGANTVADACKINSAPSVKGFDVRVFQYTAYDSPDAVSIPFVTGGYLSHSLVASTTGVQSINTERHGFPPVPTILNMYGISFDVDSFVIEITSYFYAEEDGIYTLSFTNVDDSATLFFADGSAFVCCTQHEVISNPTYRMISFLQLNSQTDNVQTYQQYLKAGYYYPLKIVWVNVVTDYVMNFAITTPSGQVIKDASTQQFFSPASVDVSQCSQTSVSTSISSLTTSWTGAVASTSVIYAGAGNGVTELVILPDPTTTVVTPWTGLYISNTIVTPNGAGTWSDLIFTPRATDTSTMGWTETYNTYTTVSPVNPDQHVTILEKTADARQTITEVWTGHSTLSVTEVPANPAGDTVTVEVFTPRATDKTTVSWTGSYTSSTTEIPDLAVEHATIIEYDPDPTTYITDVWTGLDISSTVLYPIGGSGTITVEVFTPRATNTISVGYTDTTDRYYTTVNPADPRENATVVINTPDPRTTETAPWTGTYNSSTTEDQLIPGGTVTVEVFTARGIDYTTQGWTGTVISTFGTYSPANANEHATVYVEIPDPRTTTTQAWTGTYNYSFTEPVYGSNGTVTIEVFTARGTYYTTRGWTGTIATTYATVSPIDPNQEVAVYVEIPDPRTTVDVYWTNSYESTLTTVGNIYGNDTVTVEDLIPRPTVTTTEMWTGSYTSYYTDAPADANMTATVYVDVPKPTLYYTEVWSETYTSYTTEFPWLPSGNVIVHEYDPAAFTTTTETWTGDFTSYYTAPMVSGTVEVFDLVPETTTTVTNYWPGDYTAYYTAYPINPADGVTVYENEPQHVYTITDHETETLTSTTCPLSGETTSITTTLPGSSSGPSSDVLFDSPNPSTLDILSLKSYSEPSFSYSRISSQTSLTSGLSLASSFGSPVSSSSINFQPSSSAATSSSSFAISSSITTTISVQTSSTLASAASSIVEIDYSNGAALVLGKSICSMALSAILSIILLEL